MLGRVNTFVENIVVEIHCQTTKIYYNLMIFYMSNNHIK